jgi:hypothetical protein
VTTSKGEIDESKRRKAKHAIDIQVTAFPRLDATPLRKNIGSFNSTTQDTDTIIVEGNGFASLNASPTEKIRAGKMLGRYVVDAANVVGLGASVTFGYTKRPYNIRRLEDWESSMPERVRAALVDIRAGKPPTNRFERMAADYQSIHDQITGGTGQDIYAWTALTAPRPSAWPQDINNGVLTLEELSDAPIARAALRLESNLRLAGMKHAQVLDMPSMLSFAHTSWNMEPQQWFKLVDEPDEAAWEPGTPPYYPWTTKEPITGRDEKGLPFIDLGGTKLRVWQVTSLEDRMVYADAILPVLETRDIVDVSRVGLTLSTTGDLFVSKKASKRMDVLINTMSVVDEIARGSRDNGRHVSTREVIETGQRAELQDILDRGGTMGIYYTTYAVVSGLTTQDLTIGDRSLLEHARTANLVFKPVRSVSRYIRHLNAALYGVGGV